MHSPSAHRALRPGQKLFANESNFRLAYTGIINQIRLTINHSGLFYTLKTVKSPFKVKHFVNFANFSVNFGLFLLRFFTVCHFSCFLPCPAHKAKASALRRPGRIADAFCLVQYLRSRRISCAARLANRAARMSFSSLEWSSISGGMSSQEASGNTTCARVPPPGRAVSVSFQPARRR